jgi:hypothetical protein
VRRLLISVLALLFAAAAAYASACSSAKGAKPKMILDHYVYDPSLRRDWEVLIDCNHPAAPAQMKLASNRTGTVQIPKHTAATAENNPAPAIKAGADVEVSNGSNPLTSIRLSGTAMQTAFPGQPIRVRLNVSGRFVTGLVRGPHSVELISAAKPLWGPQ